MVLRGHRACCGAGGTPALRGHSLAVLRTGSAHVRQRAGRPHHNPSQGTSTTLAYIICLTKLSCTDSL